MKINPHFITRAILLEKGIFTYKKISDQLQFSQKSIRNQMPQIEDFLALYQITLEKQSGIGIQLRGSQKNILRCYQECIKNIHDTHQLPSRIRKNILIFHLLTSQKPCRMSDLERLLYITRPSIYRDLKEINSFFSLYEIQLTRSRKEGIFLLCGEKRRRRCLLDWAEEMQNENLDEYQSYPNLPLYLNYLFDDTSSHYRSTLSSFLMRCSNFASIKINTPELEHLITLFLISFSFIKKNQTVSLNKEISQKIKNKKILQFIQEHQLQLEKKFSLSFTESEISYLAAFISSSFIPSYPLAFSESSNSQLLLEVINDYEQLLQRNIQSFDHHFFKLKLFPFLEKVMQKSNFEFDLYNPLEKEIQKNYPQLFSLACQLNPIMKEKVRKELTPSGLASLTLLLATLKERSTHRLTCYYISENYLFEDDYNLTLLANHFSYVQIVTDETIADYREEDIDFIISNKSLPHLKKPTLLAPPLFNDEFIQLLYRNLFELLQDKKDQFFL